MSKFLNLSFLILLSLVTVPASTHTAQQGIVVHFTIQDENKRPIHGAWIEIKHEGKQFPTAAPSSSNGTVSIETVAGNHTVKVTMSGYEDYAPQASEAFAGGETRTITLLKKSQ